MISPLASLGLTFDQRVAESGLPKASEWVLTNWCKYITANGTQNIPAEDPLLIVSNHPGTTDGLIVFSQVGRQEIRWISTEVPFLDNLPHTRNRIIFASKSKLGQYGQVEIDIIDANFIFVLAPDNWVCQIQNVIRAVKI